MSSEAAAYFPDGLVEPADTGKVADERKCAHEEPGDSNTFLPLAVNPTSSEFNTKPCIVASIDLATKETNCLVSKGDGAVENSTRLVDIAFGQDNNEAFLLEDVGSQQVELLLYRFSAHTWRFVSSQKMNREAIDLPNTLFRKTLVPTPVRLFVHEDLNSPPALWAEDMGTQRRWPFWDPNPQLAQLQFGEATKYQWKDGTGYEWTGALIKPVGFVPGKRYPFVIQMYSFREREFLTDGTDPTAFAARHLASVGFIVLQIQKKKDTLSQADPADALEGYRSAIASLSEEGLIDRNRGGVIGFSWTYWYVVNALTKDPTLFAAATVADGIDNSYFQYQLLAEGSYPIRHQMERIYGAAPLGPGLSSWLENAPSFHLDRIKTPLRMEAINPLSLLGEWELYASLRLQAKAVDLIYFPEGTHIHQRPFERLESQQGDVDWFRFWLQNYEDPDPSKQDQYRRWHQLGELQTVQAAESRSR